MKDYNFGSIDKRNLTIRVYNLPWYTGLRRFFSRNEYAFSFGAAKGVNHRCYCPTGRSISGRICIAGFGMTFWHSSYDGEVPCICDQTFQELEREEDQRSTSVITKNIEEIARELQPKTTQGG